MKRASSLLLLLLALWLAAACTTARRSEPVAARPVPLNDARLARGHLVYMENCQKCHPGGEAGAGPSLNNVPLPGVALRARVRSRAFFLGVGRMPSFKKNEISSEQLDDLVAYLKALRRAKPDEALTSGPVRDPKKL
ncbi:hypothetical protein GCM10023185_03610 [Hymenobacter saemangeumensis]|uniref:Cytochrome c domain-containing protein n=1 Tax=Hymenobacter saemangeumensis TaxID=1084522 RepID=A0ABP8HZJ2_9BACT